MAEPKGLQDFCASVSGILPQEAPQAAPSDDEETTEDDAIMDGAQILSCTPLATPCQDAMYTQYTLLPRCRPSSIGRR